LIRQYEVSVWSFKNKKRKRDDGKDKKEWEGGVMIKTTMIITIATGKRKEKEREREGLQKKSFTNQRDSAGFEFIKGGAAIMHRVKGEGELFL
jgi:hypothetical protein